MAQIEGRDQFFTLTAGTVYVGIGGDASLVQSCQVQWDGVWAGAITFEDSNRDPKVVTLSSTTKGEWIQENPSSGVYISTVSTDGTTGGATVTNMSITVVAGTQGGAMVNIGNAGGRRWRAKVVTTTPGALVFSTNSKE